MANLLMELDSSGIKSTSEIATPLQSASAWEEVNQKRNLLAAGRGGSTQAGLGGKPCLSRALLAHPANPFSIGRSQSSSVSEGFHQQHPQFPLVPRGWCFYCPKLRMRSSPCHACCSHLPLPTCKLEASHSTSEVPPPSSSPSGARLERHHRCWTQHPSSQVPAGDGRTHSDASRCSAGHPHPYFCRTGCVQTPTAGTKPQPPQNTALV